MTPSHILAFNLVEGSQKKVKNLNRCFFLFFFFFAMSIVSAGFVKEKDDTTTFLEMDC